MSEREGINYLNQLAYLVLILSASFEERSSILTVVLMKVAKEHIRHILLYEFNKQRNEKCENIKAEYGDRTISVSQCQRWFQKFRAGNSLEDELRPERSVELDEDILHPDGTKSYRNYWKTSREAWIWSFDHSSTPACHRKS